MQIICEDRLEAYRSPMHESTHSTATSDSASQIGRTSEEKWQEVASRLRCTLITTPRTAEGASCFTEETKYPRYVKDQECIEWISEFEVRKEMKKRTKVFRARSFAQWVNILPDSRLEERDPFQIKRWLNTILYAWNSHETANARERQQETEIRLGVDVLMELAFECRSGGKHSHRAERDLFLPASPWTTTADNVFMIDLPPDWARFLMMLPNNQIFSSDVRDGSNMSVVTFVCEDKVNDALSASRQLTMDLCSAQHQRRALGFDDSMLFGATMVDTDMHIYVSNWEEGKVVVQATEINFSLGVFDEFLSCYIFLCKLADMEAAKVQKVLDMWHSESGKETLKDRNRRESAKTPWRLVGQPKPSEGKRSKKRKQTGGASDDVESQYMEDWESFDEDVDDVPMKVCATDEEQVPPGGDQLNEENLHVLDAHDADYTRTKLTKDIGIWAQHSILGSDNLVE